MRPISEGMVKSKNKFVTVGTIHTNSHPEKITVNGEIHPFPLLEDALSAFMTCNWVQPIPKIGRVQIWEFSRHQVWPHFLSNPVQQESVHLEPRLQSYN